MTQSLLHNWYPVSLCADKTGFNCRWKYFKDVEFTDPFFNETVSKAESLEINSYPYRILSSLSILPEWSNTHNDIEPTLFIFHISRCGSTLLSQSLNLNNAHIVLSEVPFIDDILKQLSLDEWLINTEYQEILKSAIKLYGRKRNQGEEKLFIKTDSWHLHYLPLFRLLYPTTPFLLLYRKPDEVLSSQQKKRGLHAVPGLIANNILGIEPGNADTVNFDQHIIKVLESYFKSMIAIFQKDYLTILANYNQGIASIINDLSKFITIDFDESYWIKVNERGLYHAKFPGEHFKEVLTENPYPSTLNKAFLLYDELEKLKSYQASDLRGLTLL